MPDSHISQRPATTSFDVAPVPAVPRMLPRVGTRRQLLLASYWFSLSFQGGALLGVAVPAQLLALARNADKAWWLGLLGGSSALIGMLSQPIAGVLSDLSSASWGRRRSYLVGGALIDIAGLLLMARAADLGTLFVGFALTGLGGGVSLAAYQAYVPDHVPPEQYGEASGYIGAMTMVGTVASFGMSALLVAPGSAASFYIATLAVIGIGAAVIAYTFPEPSLPRRKRPMPSWRALWLNPWKHTDFTLVFITRAMMMLALYTLFTFVEYYVQDILHVTKFVQGAALVAGIATLAALFGGLATGITSDRVGRRAIVSIAAVVMAGALAVLAFIHDLNVVLGVGVAFGLALGAFAAVDWALAIDVLPDQDFAAKDLGLWGISTSLPQTLAPVVGGAVLALLAPHGEVTGYTVLFLGAACCAAASGLLVWRLRTVR